MGIDTPIVDYSALSSSSSGNVDVMNRPTHLRFRWNRIFKRFYHDENNREQTMTMNVEERINPVEKTMTSLHNRNKLNGKQNQLKSSSSFESLPFTDPYFSNEKFIEQRKPWSTSVTCIAMTKPVDDERDQFWSTISPSDCHRVSSLSPSSRLRRLQSKSKIRSVTNASRLNKCHTSSLFTSPRRSSISSSIARRIELLKEAVEHHQRDAVKSSKENIDNARSICKIAHQSTQTNEQLFDSTVFHSIHHHYLHCLPYFSIEWRSIFSIAGMMSLIVLFVIDVLGVFL